MPRGGYRQSMTVPTDPYHRQRVRYAVIALQREMIRQGFLATPTAPLGGGYGPLTAKAATEFQRSVGITADGWIGPRTARHLFRPLIADIQTERAIPDNLLYGQARLESGMDPGAEGAVDDRDRGMFQYNRRWHPDVTDEMAFSDVPGCARRAADALAAAYNRYGLWPAAVASHNNPSKALAWSRTGVAPDQQIADYVRLVYEAAALPI